MLIDKAYRKKVVENVTDPLVKSFWVEEFANYTDRYTQDATPAIQNKVGQFTGNPLVRNIVGQPKSTFDIRKMMDDRKILICNLSKGKVGEVNANLLGSMLITKIYLAAMSRADVSASELKRLPNFYFYVDEFQSFANESFADILSEARKYKLNLTIAHQYIEQMSEEVRAAVFGNVGTMICFRVGAFDADVLEKEFYPTFTATDLVNLGFTQIYLKLMIDGVSSQPFSATTLPPIEEPEVSLVDKVVQTSREQYAKPRMGVEEAINAVYKPADKPVQQQNQGGGRGQGGRGSFGQGRGQQGGGDRRDFGHGNRERRDGPPRRFEQERPAPQMDPSEHRSQLADIARAMQEKHKAETEAKNEEKSVAPHAEKIPEKREERKEQKQEDAPSTIEKRKESPSQEVQPMTATTPTKQSGHPPQKERGTGDDREREKPRDRQHGKQHDNAGRQSGRQKNERPRRKGKGATEETRASLRSALAGILVESQGDQNTSSDGVDEKRSTEKSDTHKKVKTTEEGNQVGSTHPGVQKQREVPSQEKQGERNERASEPQRTKDKKTESSRVDARTGPKEVPEDVLKRILEVPED